MLSITALWIFGLKPPRFAPLFKSLKPADGHPLPKKTAHDPPDDRATHGLGDQTGQTGQARQGGERVVAAPAWPVRRLPCRMIGGSNQ